MSVRNPHRHGRLSPGAILCSTSATITGVVMLMSTPAYAAVTPGETFVYDWAEISHGQPVETGTADFTLGSASTTMPGWFTISAFAVSSFGGHSPKTENLTDVLFDPATDGVVGSITGTFIGHGGGTHTFDLVTTNLPDGTWSFTNASSHGTVTDSGTYTTAAATKTSVDEPGILLLLIPAGVTLLAARRRRSG